MPPTIYNMTAVHGDTWGIAVSCSYLLSGTATVFDLTNYEAKAQIRKRAEANTVAAEYTCTIPIPSAGVINLDLAASATELIPAGTYMWDMQISGTSASGTAITSGAVYTVVAGSLAVSPDVTR